ncbi:MAG: hypothetical protein ACI8TA_003287 [Cyclobacteriaceae bacterium]|jgi:hypothetical protein
MLDVMLMRIFIAIFLLSSFISCQQRKIDVEGFWVGTTEEGVIEITSDSIFIYNPFGLSLKSTYNLENRRIKMPNTYEFFAEEIFQGPNEVEVDIIDDTLIWKLHEYPLKFIRSKFDTYVEHYANSQGLKIELPISNKFLNTSHINYCYSDFFIGYNSNYEVEMKLNGEVVNSFNDLPRLLNIEKEICEYRLVVLRIFADKSIDMNPIQELHNSMRQSNFLRIHYVSKPDKRVFVNMLQNPYSNSFYGNKILIRDTPAAN